MWIGAAGFTPVDSAALRAGDARYDAGVDCSTPVEPQLTAADPDRAGRHPVDDQVDGVGRRLHGVGDDLHGVRGLRLPRQQLGRVRRVPPGQGRPAGGAGRQGGRAGGLHPRPQRRRRVDDPGVVVHRPRPGRGRVGHRAAVPRQPADAAGVPGPLDDPLRRVPRHARRLGLRARRRRGRPPTRRRRAARSSSTRAGPVRRSTCSPRPRRSSRRPSGRAALGLADPCDPTRAIPSAAPTPEAALGATSATPAPVDPRHPPAATGRAARPRGGRLPPPPPAIGGAGRRGLRAPAGRRADGLDAALAGRVPAVRGRGDRRPVALPASASLALSVDRCHRASPWRHGAATPTGPAHGRSCSTALAVDRRRAAVGPTHGDAVRRLGRLAHGHRRRTVVACRRRRGCAALGPPVDPVARPRRRSSSRSTTSRPWGSAGGGDVACVLADRP